MQHSLLHFTNQYQVHDNEVMRAYKTVNDSYIEPISFTVPRRAETFQADIFPPAFGIKPAMSAQEWLDGKTAVPAKLDLESVYEGNAPKEVPSDYKPPASVQATPVSKPSPPKEEPKREEPKPVSRGPPPSMNEQKNSMAAAANRFQDNEEDEAEEEEDETSSFEEVSRPQPRSSMPIRSEPKPAAAHVPAPIKTASPVRANAPSATPTPTTATVAPPSSAADPSLDQIKKLLENQNRLLAAQSEQIGHLTTEVDALKRKVGSGGSQDQSERIRQLELELEAARS